MGGSCMDARWCRTRWVFRLKLFAALRAGEGAGAGVHRLVADQVGLGTEAAGAHGAGVGPIACVVTAWWRPRCDLLKGGRTARRRGLAPALEWATRLGREPKRDTLRAGEGPLACVHRG